MDLQASLPLLPFAFIASFSPGPNNILVMSCGIRNGAKATLPYQLGAGIACFIIIGLCIGLGAAIERTLPVLLPAVRVVGCVYILWLAYAVATAPAPQSGAEEGSAATCRNGFILQFINPKFYLYTLTLAAVLGPGVTSLFAVSFYGVLFALIAVAGMAAWALAGAMLHSFLHRHYKVVNACMGLALVWCALSLF